MAEETTEISTCAVAKHEDLSCIQTRYTAYDRRAFVLCKYTISFWPPYTAGISVRARLYNIPDNRHNGPAVTASVVPWGVGCLFSTISSHFSVIRLLPNNPISPPLFTVVHFLLSVLPRTFIELASKHRNNFICSFESHVVDVYIIY